jgi:hypothetical protein
MSEARYLTHEERALINDLLENDTDARLRHGQDLLDMMSAKQGQGSAGEHDFLDLLRRAHAERAEEGAQQ